MSDLISRQAAIDAIVKLTNCNTPKVLKEYVAEHSLWSLWSGGVLEALEAVEGLPSAEPDLQPTCNQLATDTNVLCKDTISRQDAIDALKICDNNEDGINCHKCPLRDERWDGAWEDNETNCYTKLMRDSAKLLELPSAQPERKKGRWYKPTGMMPPEYAGRHRCSECDGFAMHDWKTHREVLTDFCPWCNADMREGREND